MMSFKKKQNWSDSMKKIAVLLIAATMCVLLVVCWKETPQEIVSRELGVDVSDGTEISYEDTHGGFHGDGDTIIALKFDDNSVTDEIKGNSKWKEFPINETTQALVYGIEKENRQYGPFLNDGKGNALMPKIQNGYYILIDRNPETDTDILERPSFNFTVGLYDTDTNIMYFGKMDT